VLGSPIFYLEIGGSLSYKPKEGVAVIANNDIKLKNLVGAGVNNKNK